MLFLNQLKESEMRHCWTARRIPTETGLPYCWSCCCWPLPGLHGVVARDQNHHRCMSRVLYQPAANHFGRKESLRLGLNRESRLLKCLKEFVGTLWRGSLFDEDCKVCSYNAIYPSVLVCFCLGNPIQFCAVLQVSSGALPCEFTLWSLVLITYL